MAARSISSAAISFGLVTVPVKVYPAVKPSAGLSFHMLHEKDGSRVRQQYVCLKDGETVARSELVLGYEFAKGRWVSFTDASRSTTRTSTCCRWRRKPCARSS